ncbi:hypothetical protein, unknown function [Leishmania tarentolae]|uniref:Uncharacterized protein n=1 Tax=Leishmania tarentolae TaxID=5689 RepID=A0A640KBM6_LEITA|nr:hypothetical protein, unknown function [Leishmania tarentolae]
MSPFARCTIQSRPCVFPALLLATVVCLLSSFSRSFIFPGVLHAAARLPSHDLFLVRAGSTYNYTMYSGSAVTGESHLTGHTTYPYVFSADMNSAIVAMLNGFLSSTKSNLSAVGGGFVECIDNNLASIDGRTCFKSLLAAAPPADCPAANKLCCPLFWRVERQDPHTTMAHVIPKTLFWNGAMSVNGFYTNFSRSYLDANRNCSKPLFGNTSLINLAMDAHGEWRFVSLVTTYTLLETATNLNASSAAPIFGENPQIAITSTTTSQKPFYKIITACIAGGVDVLLLLFLIFFLAVVGPYIIGRPAIRVRELQLLTVNLVSQYHKNSACTVLDELSSSEECSSSRKRSRDRNSSAWTGRRRWR